MIIVTGSILAREDSYNDLLAICLEHVRRSRTEPGCLAHAVFQDAENPLRLVFLEEWADRASLEAHFAVPDSREFVKVVRELSAAPPEMNIFNAIPLSV
jgi:quinol monooxygenase YgiN